MNRIQILIVVALAHWAPALIRADCVYSNSFTFNSVSYAQIVYQEVLEKTPRWKPGAECPPISPGKAEAIAADYADQRLKAGEWVAKQIALVHEEIIDPGCWFYVVDLRPPGMRVLDGLCIPIRLVVLMDGTVVPLQPPPKPPPVLVWPGPSIPQPPDAGPQDRRDPKP